MTDAIASWVTSLGDFPLDPDAGFAWLWSGGGDRLLWVSAAARADMTPEGLSAPADAALVRSFAPLLALAEPDREPIRVHQLAPGAGPRPPVHTCLCRHVPLREGGYGLLAVAIGAPARSMAEVRGEPPEPRADRPSDQHAAEQASLFDEPPQREDAAQDAASPQDEPAVQAEPVQAAEPPPAPEAPEWTGVEPGDRSPVRFVWQTGPDGRFVHISRELAAAVGPGRAMVLGRTWEEIAEAFGLEEWDGVAAGFLSRDTWTAPPVLWPVENADLGVPVEMAGLRVLEAGRFDGFRGYGIARIERAVARSSSAAEALAGDADDEADEEPAAEPLARMRDLRRPAARMETDAPRTGEPAQEPAGIVPDQAGDDEAALVGSPPVASAADAAAIPAVEVADMSPEKPASREQPPAEPLPATQPAARLAVSAPPSTTPAQGESSLSASEREAFREIAKALGAMTENLGRQTVPQAQRSQEVRPLEIVRRDIVHLAPRIGSPRAAVAQPPAADLRESRPVAPSPLQTAAPALLDALPAGLMIVQNGEAVFANRSLLALAGYPDLAAFRAEGGLARLFGSKDGGTAAGRFDLKTRSGEVAPVEATVQAVEWSGEPAVLTTLRPAVDAVAAPRMRALEMDLRAAQSELRELRSVLDTATDGVILLDAEGRILSLNRSAEALFGYDQNEIAGEKLTLLLESDSHIAALDYLEGLKSNGVNSILNDGRDVRGRERNGGSIPLFMTIGRIGDRDGGAKFCAVLRDVTHWKKVEADLLEAKRAAEDANAHKSDFLARISHEVRTPLNAIIGFSQVMVAESFGPIGNDRYRQYAKDIHASGEHVVSLVNDLLDLSKIAAGRLDLTFGSVDVNAVVAGTVAMIQPQANANRVIVRSQLAHQLPAVVADERSLRQIMLNLLSNAARYTEPGGQVVASTSLSDRGEVVIRVSDTGIGMADEEVRRAMEPFRQIPGPRSGGGTGLGLPLTKALVEANRAAFSIRSEPRKGTLVEVVFPSTRVLAE